MENNWISVEDGLPENADDVLVFMKEECISLAEYKQGKWKVYSTPYFFSSGNVTHWMPLPSPPTTNNR